MSNKVTGGAAAAPGKRAMNTRWLDKGGFNGPAKAQAGKNRAATASSRNTGSGSRPASKLPTTAKRTAAKRNK